MKKIISNCPVCNSTEISITTAEEKFEYKGKFLSLKTESYSCANCTEEFITKESHKKIEKPIRDFQRMVDGFLTSKKIKKVRKSLGFTQEDFSTLLGVGEKSFARYENGTVTQSKAMDNLIKIVDHYPFVLGVISTDSVKTSASEPINYSTIPKTQFTKYNFDDLEKLTVNKNW